MGVLATLSVTAAWKCW